MLREEYVKHFELMSDRVREEEWTKLEENKKEFFETGNAWGMSWLGHLTVLDASVFYYTKEQKWLDKMKECLAVFLDMQDELVRRFEDGSLSFMKKLEEAEGKHISGPPKNPLEVMQDEEINPWHLQVLETIFSFTPVLRALHMVGKEHFTAQEWERLEVLCYAEINHIFHDCEWGRHNRATLRGIAMLLFAKVFPKHEAAGKCIKLADMLFSDSLGNWSIEDATSYLGLWLNSLVEYTQYRGVWNFRIEQILSYYCHYYTAMLLPSGGLPEFGDTRFDSGTSSMLSLGAMELIAGKHRDGVLKYAIERQFYNMIENLTMDNGTQYQLGMTNAFLLADDSVQPTPPELLSCEVLEELVGKKVAFRNSWEKDATFLLYNYRDVGPYGKLTRDYLQNTIPVHAEKPHHGHADEQSICALCANGAIFLRDGGYRDGFTTNGHYRADFYHNRLVMRNGRMLNEKGFLEYAENIGEYLAVETEKIMFQQFECAEVVKTRLYDRFHNAQADRHVLYIKEANLFVVVDTVHPAEEQEMTNGVMYLAENIEQVDKGVYRIQQDSHEGLVHFNRYKREKQQSHTQTLCVAFAGANLKYSVEELRRNYRQEKALSCYTSRYYARDEYFTVVSLLVPEIGNTAEEVQVAQQRAEKIAASLRLSQTHMGKQAEILFVADEKEYTIGIQCDDKAAIKDKNLRPTYDYEVGKATYGSFTTDAKLLVSNGHTYGMVDGTRVDYKGETVFQAASNRQNQLDFMTVLQVPTTWGSFEDTLD